MPDDFKTQIDRFVIKSEARLLAVVKGAFSAVVEDAQTPVKKGGKMRVDTGFLRSSGIASLNAAPRGVGRGRKRLPGEEGELPEYRWPGESLNTILARLKIGDAIYFGWTAKYAKYRELYDAFLESALQKWQTHVDAQVKKFRDKDMGV